LAAAVVDVKVEIVAGGSPIDFDSDFTGVVVPISIRNIESQFVSVTLTAESSHKSGSGVTTV
jgi:hypothetical protein